MARTRRIKSEAVGTAYYHLMSRTNDKRFLFDRGRVKTQLVDALKRAAAFSGVEIDAYVAMDNHFHVVWASRSLAIPREKSNLPMSISSTVNGLAVFQPPRV